MKQIKLSLDVPCAPESEQIKALESLLVKLGGEKWDGEWVFPVALMHAREYEILLARVGAKKIADNRGYGQWHWPFYRPDDEPLMLPTAEWIEARKAAAQVLSRAGESDCDRASGEVLPDLDGQNLTD